MLADAGGVMDDRTVAKIMWPDSPLWDEDARVAGAGGFREKGVKLHSVAAGLLGRIARRGLARRLRKGVTEITPAGRAYLERVKPTPAPPPPPAVIPPHPVYAPPGTHLYVLDQLGARWPATVVSYSGHWLLVQYANGAQAWIDPRSARVA